MIDDNEIQLALDWLHTAVMYECPLAKEEKQAAREALQKAHEQLKNITEDMHDTDKAISRAIKALAVEDDPKKALYELRKDGLRQLTQESQRLHLYDTEQD